MDLNFSGKHVLVTGGAMSIGQDNFEVDSDKFVQEFAERYIPMNRVGKFEDISLIFLFLASDQARYITSQTFVIDRGQLAGQKPRKELLKQMSSF
jgi:hypothetical protein